MEFNLVIFIFKIYVKFIEKNKIFDNCMEFCFLVILFICFISLEKCGCIFTESK